MGGMGWGGVRWVGVPRPGKRKSSHKRNVGIGLVVTGRVGAEQGDRGSDKNFIYPKKRKKGAERRCRSSRL